MNKTIEIPILKLTDYVDRVGVLDRVQTRALVVEAGYRLAEHTRAQVSSDGPVLVVIILRGGALLQPGFASLFPDADFCYFAIQRTNGGEPEVSYVSGIPQRRYDVVIYVDCIAATGRTILTVRRHLNDNADGPSREIVAVLFSAQAGTNLLSASGMDIFGSRLRESLNGDIVGPDLGMLDAGDLFASTYPMDYS